MLKKIILLILSTLMFGCSTVATESEDGRTLTIRGSGSAKFESGAEIQGGSFLPPLPKIELDT